MVAPGVNPPVPHTNLPHEGRLGKAGDAPALTKWSHNPMMSLSRRSTRRYIKCRLITSPSSPPSLLRESGMDPRSYRKDTSTKKPTSLLREQGTQAQKLQGGTSKEKKTINTSPCQRVDSRLKPAPHEKKRKGGRISQGQNGDPSRGDNPAQQIPTPKD